MKKRLLFLISVSILIPSFSITKAVAKKHSGPSLKAMSIKHKRSKSNADDTICGVKGNIVYQKIAIKGGDNVGTSWAILVPAPDNIDTMAYWKKRLPVIIANIVKNEPEVLSAVKSAITSNELIHDSNGDIRLVTSSKTYSAISLEISFINPYSKCISLMYYYPL